VLLLPVATDGGMSDPGQDRFSPGRNRMIRRSSGLYHAAWTADITGAYTPHDQPDRIYEKVQRSLIWIKTDEAGSSDLLLERDLVRLHAGAPTGLQAIWQLHLDGDPTLTGSHAEVQLDAPDVDQRLVIDILKPSDAVFSVVDPEGPPDEYPAQVYTYRLQAAAALDQGERVLMNFLGASDEGRAVVQPLLVESSTTEGVLAGTDVLLFAKGIQDDADGGALDLVLDLPTEDPVRVFILGMAPALSFDISAVQNGGTLGLEIHAGAGIAADEGGLLAFLIDGNRDPEALYELIFEDGFETRSTEEWSRVTP